MKKLRGEFKEQLEELKESLTERFHSIDERIQRLKLESEENNWTISTAVQFQRIRNQLETVEERIRRLEALNQRTNTQVNLRKTTTISFFKLIKN